MKDLITSAIFIKSSATIDGCPEPNKPEFAFIGRSNVGKSTLLNVLTGRKKLAKTSATPGKTQLINHFLINECWYLVDLPGYGWAKVSKQKKAAWEEAIRDYILRRSNLVLLFVLVDVRLPPQAIDLDFINWAGAREIPLALIFTKADKLSKNKVQSQVAQFERALKNTWEELPTKFITSSLSGEGREQVLTYLIDVYNQVK